MKDSPARLFPPPLPTTEPIVAPLPRVPTPPISSPPSQERLWKTPLKRKFAELTEHSITSTLTDEEEWFGSEPKGGGSADSRRFSGRMRFIGPDDSTPTTSLSNRTSDENSLEMRPRRTGVSPALVLRAQNLVSAEILSEKLLHPPRSVGTGVDEMSHAAVQEGSINRPISVGGGESATGKQSIGERSFDVFQDDNDDVMSGMEILPKELTRPTQVGQRTTPPVEKRPPPPRPQLDESPARKAPQLQNTEPQPPSSFARSEKEYDEEELDEYDENGVLVPPTERRYYRPETRGSSLDRISEFDRVDYEQPETYSDDEELLGEDFEEEEDLHHAGYYFQDRRTRREEEEYYEEEEYSDEDEDVREVEEKNPVQGNAPEVVDLTLD